MNNNLLDSQVKRLASHMKDYQQAYQLSKKGETAIFNKHRISDKEFGPGLRDDLEKHREVFANEWGPTGWRNVEFAKQQILEAQRPTEDEMNKMHDAQKETKPENSQQFLENLQENRVKRQNTPKPGMR